MPQARRTSVPDQLITAKVEKVFPFGVFVRLADGTRAYIRRRELSLEGDVDPRELVSEGQIIRAVILSLPEPGKLMELSVRKTLADPWQRFLQKYKKGDVVTATVKHLSPHGIFVQILPGVNGFIPLEELALWKVSKPEDVVWTGDLVEAVITQIYLDRRKVTLSIRRRMEQLIRVEDVLKRVVHTEGQIPATQDAGLEETVTSGREPSDERGEIGPILVVDDYDLFREPLVEWLRGQGYTALGVKTASEALAVCQQKRYGLVLVDLELPEVNGLDLIRRLRACGDATFVAVMGSPEWIEERFAEIQELGVVEMFPKPINLERLQQFLIKLDSGELVEPEVRSTQASLAESPPSPFVGSVMRSGRPLTQRFLQGLTYLLETTPAEQAIVFHLDHTSQMVSIAAAAGSIPIDEKAAYSLINSPVKDVIEEGIAIWENRVSQEVTGKYDKLLALLPFESCIGVPVEAGERIEYALFLFHREPEAFSRYRLRDARAMATYFAAAVEQQILNKRLQDLNRVLLSGHLAASLGHEIYNRLSGLELEFQNMRADFEHLWQNYPELQEDMDSREVRYALDRAVEVATDMRRMVEKFRLLLRAIQEERWADVNEAVRQSAALVKPLADRERVIPRLNLSPDIPPVPGSTHGLQQAFLNLMLNAVQHMALKPGGHRVLEVSTTWKKDGHQRRVEVRFSDSGPGIHRQLWEKIFTLGFTTKPGGSGLGLYIARSLVESMGGRISVETSFVPLGTTFLVELPTAEEE